MKLALGSVQFGLDYGVANHSGPVTESTARDILEVAKCFGLDTIDTAIAYGNSEEVLGKLGVGTWKIVTKIPEVPVGCNDVDDWIFKQIKNSMMRIGTKQLYGVLLHSPSQLMSKLGIGIYRALQNLKQDGLTQKIGISVYGFKELEDIILKYKMDLVQAPLNILDRSLVDSGWASRLHHLGIEVHIRSVFLQGLLLMKSSQRPAIFNQWKDVWRIWDRWLEEEGLSPIQACIRYVNSIDEIDRVIIGVDTVEQLNQIIDASAIGLSSLPDFQQFKDPRLINPAFWPKL